MENDLKIDSELLYFYNCIILCSSVGPSIKCFPAKFGPVPVPGMFTPTEMHIRWGNGYILDSVWSRVNEIVVW